MDYIFQLILNFLLGALIAIIIIVLFNHVRKKRKFIKKGNKIYLLGPSGCGKTRFFHFATRKKQQQHEQLDEEEVKTVTSVECNEAAFMSGDMSNKLTLVDTPGHARLRLPIEELTEIKALIVWCAPFQQVDWEYTVKLFLLANQEEFLIVCVHALTSSQEIIKKRLQQALDAMTNQEGFVSAGSTTTTTTTATPPKNDGYSNQSLTFDHVYFCPQEALLDIPAFQ